jgi:hypothetical protein
VGLGGAAEDGTEGSRKGAGGFRRCLRPSDCPYAQAAPGVLAAAGMWGAALAELLPGDHDLAWEITELLVAQGVLGADGVTGVTGEVGVDGAAPAG